MTGSECSRERPRKWPKFSLKPYQIEIESVAQITREGKKYFGWGKNDLNIFSWPLLWLLSCLKTHIDYREFISKNRVVRSRFVTHSYLFQKFLPIFYNLQDTYLFPTAISRDPRWFNVLWRWFRVKRWSCNNKVESQLSPFSPFPPLLFKEGGCLIFVRWMFSLTVKINLNIVEQWILSFHPVLKLDMIDQLSFNWMKKDSATALSQQFPFRPMLWTNPCFLSTVLKPELAYWTPRSLWIISPRPGLRLMLALLSALITECLSSESLRSQPTTIRENRSIKTVR